MSYHLKAITREEHLSFVRACASVSHFCPRARSSTGPRWIWNTPEPPAFDISDRLRRMGWQQNEPGGEDRFAADQPRYVLPPRAAAAAQWRRCACRGV
ncbi:hypothetical protein [Streptomyces sp. Inha503]|uniref:hypothetical protein n=1 Tax=Streptomyces sp. Inha503 TaxID=3383314 RepID=UPI0039A2952B